MDRRGRAMSPRFPSLRRAALLGLPCVAAGCVDGSPAALLVQPPPVVRAAAPEIPTVAHGKANVVPISLDTVLRLADEQNLQIAQAREKVNEAVAQQDLACRWVPELYVGTAYYRHEGGIQNEDGTFIRSSTGSDLSGLDLRAKVDPREIAYQRVLAARKAWQQKGELSRLSAETVLEAANTYIDLLTAHAGTAVNRDIENDLREVLGRAEKLARTEPGSMVEVERVRAEIDARRGFALKLEAQIAGASAKLVYLLGMDPCTEVIPADSDLLAFHLIDASLPTCELVAQATSRGPGVQELAGLVSLIEDAIAKAKGAGRLLPTVELRMTEGGFGAGPHANLTWDNRFDAALQVRWNISDLLTTHERSRIADAQRQQAHYAYDDLLAKLTAGVREAHESILSGNGQVALGQTQIGHAREARRLSKQRLEEGIQGSSTSEVLLSLQSLGRAQLDYLSALRDYDKAQVRLSVLVGCPAPMPPAPAALPPEVGTAK